MTSDAFTEQRLAELEAKVDHMYRQLTGQGDIATVIPPMRREGAGVSEAVREIARTGNMAKAIQLQRAETGQSLSEAKDAIDRRRASPPARSAPARPTAPAAPAARSSRPPAGRSRPGR